MPSKPRITIRDVAERSGYSTYTVSSVLNNKGDIGQETSDKIRAVARQMNYGIMGTVQAQRRMTARCLGIVLPDANCLHVSFYNRALSRFRLVATQHDYDCKLFTEEDILSRTDPRKSGGPGMFGCKGLILFCPWGEYQSYTPRLLQQGIAVALIRRNIKIKRPGLFLIKDDQEKMIQRLTDYLRERCGCRRFGFVAPHSGGEHALHLEKWTNMFQELRKGGLSDLPTLMVKENPDRNSDAYPPLRPFLRQGGADRPVVVAWSDASAVRVHSFLQREGFNIPADVMLTGYNNDSVSQDISPDLTTVHAPVEEIIEQAFEYLMGYRKEGHLPPAKTQALAQKLIIRRSTNELP